MPVKTLYFTVDEAILQLHDEEESVYDHMSEAEKDFMIMQVRFALYGPIEEWHSVFVDRTTCINSKMRQNIKQRISYASSQLAILYGNGEGETHALDDLERGVMGLRDECVKAVTQLAQVRPIVAEVDKEALSAMRQRSNLRRAMASIEDDMKTLQSEDQNIAQLFKEWKPCFDIICNEVSRVKALESLSARKLGLDELQKLAQPLFAVLATLCDDHNETSRKVKNFTPERTSFWRENRGGRVSHNELESTLRECREFGDTFKALKARQCVTIDAIAHIEKRASPSSVIGPQGVEVPLANFSCAATKFEALRFRVFYARRIASALSAKFERLLCQCA